MRKFDGDLEDIFAVVSSGAIALAVIHILSPPRSSFDSPSGSAESVPLATAVSESSRASRLSFCELEASVKGTCQREIINEVTLSVGQKFLALKSCIPDFFSSVFSPMSPSKPRYSTMKMTGLGNRELRRSC